MIEPDTDLYEGISKITLRVKTEFVRMSKWMLGKRDFRELGGNGSSRPDGWMAKKTEPPFVAARQSPDFCLSAHLVDAGIAEAGIGKSTCWRKARENRLEGGAYGMLELSAAKKWGE